MDKTTIKVLLFHEYHDYIYLCREERYGRNGNLRSLRKADMTPDVVRTYFWGFIKKYWRELIGVK